MPGTFETLHYLQRILPRQKPFYPYSKGLQPNSGRGLATIEEAAQWALRVNTDVNISLTSFEDRRGGRFQASRSFWADLDVGQGKDYATQEDAVAAVNKAIANGLPPPLIISSGSGLHLIWTLEEEMNEQTWRRRSHNLLNEIRVCGLKCDGQRTTDASNGPRVIGTVNGKNAGVVRWVRRNGPIFTGSYFDARLRVPGTVSEGSGPKSAPSERSPLPEFSTLLEQQIAELTPFEHNYEGLEFDAKCIADKCAQMHALRSGARLDEPSWTALLGVLSACIRGEELAHEWSSVDERYTERETQSKLDNIRTRGYKPTTCDWFRTSGNGGGRCAGCQHDGKSPISLGRVKIIEGTIANDPLIDDDKEPEIPKAEEKPHKLPTDYTHDVQNNTITRMNAETNNWFKVCEAVFCVGRTQEGLQQSYTWEVQDGRTREWATFSLPSDECTAKSKAFIKLVLIHNDIAAEAYIRAAKGMISNAELASSTVKSFGWNEDKTSFLLGKKLYRPGKEVTETTALAPQAQDVAEALGTRGSANKWHGAALKLISAERQASIFFLMLSAGTPLHAIMSDEGGALIALRSHGSGHGKTTSLAAAMSIWGHWKTFANWSGSTTLANTSLWETLGNLPVPWDEAQFGKEEDLRDLVLKFADGEARVRASREGTRKKVGDRWSSFMFATTNTDLKKRLGTMTGATEGPAARLFQLETQLEKRLVQEDGGALLQAFNENYGWAGEKIIEGLMKPGVMEKIKVRLDERNNARSLRLDLPNSARFACRAITCAEVGGYLLRSALLPELDITKCIAAVEDMLLASIGDERELAKSQDLVAEFIRHKIGELIHLGQNVQQAPLRVISGRFEQRPEGSILTVPVATWAAWIARYNKSAPEAEREMLAMGHGIKRATVDLGRGTVYRGHPKTACIEIELDAVTALTAAKENIVPIERGKRK